MNMANVMNEYERGRRAGIIEAIGAIEQNFGALSRGDIAAIAEQARLAQFDGTEFDIGNFLLHVQQEIEEATAEEVWA
jgi:hypothetical protein